MELITQGIYTTINPDSIFMVLYKPKHVTTEVIYKPEKTIELFGKNFIISDKGFYKQLGNSKPIYLGNNITCLDKSQEYSYEYNSENDIYTIYKNAIISIITKENKNKPIIFYYKENKDAEAIYTKYVNIFNK